MCWSDSKEVFADKSLDEVVVSVLTERKDINTAAEALNCLVEEGYISKRRYKGIDELLTKAKAKR